jgi:hypothetical protein
VKPIQAILVFGFVLLGYIYQLRRKSLGRALTRISLVVFILSGSVAAFFPDIFNAIGDLVGVGRGADLLLYMTTFSLISLAFLSVSKIKILESQITKLTREISLMKKDSSD